MRNRKMIMVLAVTLMAIGFASVSTVLYLNGQTFVASNTGDFDVYFSKTVENGVENNTFIQDKTHIAFTTELTGLDDTYVLDYDVTNASKQYDANIVMNCTGGNEYLRVENKFNTEKVLPARTTRSGVLTLTVIKAVMEDTSVSISCEITGNAQERETAGGDAIEVEKDYLKIAGDSHDYLGYELNKKIIEEIYITNTSTLPTGATLIGDVSDSQNESILMYTKDEDADNMLELYIGQDGGVVANPDSSYLFGDFSNVGKIKGLENLDTSHVTNMYYMFGSCYAQLTNLDLSHFDTSKVTDMSYMFVNCEKLTKLNISSFDTSKVVNMEGMFADLGATSLELSHFDTSNVINMNSMFWNGNITSLDLIHFNTSNVTDMGEMFSGCTDLTYLNISSFDTSSVTDMHDMFYSCAFESLDLSSFNTSKVTTMALMFLNCSQLTTLDLSSFNTSKVTTMASMFLNCSQLTTLNVSNFITTNVTDMESMFSLCKALTSLDLSNFDTSNVTKMRKMFYYDELLENLDLSSFDTSKVMDMDYMFKNCSNLTNLDLSNFDTSRVIYMRGMFDNCSKIITNITIRGTNCTSYENMFKSSATSENAQITVNYTADASELVDKMIATKSSNSNIIKGSVVA